MGRPREARRLSRCVKGVGSCKNDDIPQPCSSSALRGVSPKFQPSESPNDRPSEQDEQPTGTRASSESNNSTLQPKRPSSSIRLQKYRERNGEVNDPPAPADIDPDDGEEAVEPYQITREELHAMQWHIAEAIRPTWSEGPPLLFGEAKAGKLKADEWRSAIEFDVPVSLAQILQDGSERRRRALLDTTMLLATAARWATSWKTSARHRDEYTRNMVLYLQKVKEYFPSIDLVPNHHNALHVGDYFLPFGPVHGWWMFPFERVIGLLQKTKTNFKSGAITCNAAVAHMY